MERFKRQSFLGPDSQAYIADCTVGVVGLGGGGSHIVQQLAHIGFQRYVIYDDDITEESNLNRLIGARSIDVPAETPKLHLAKMMILGLQPNASIQAIPSQWQVSPEALRTCQIIFGCVDTYRGRLELESVARRYLIHYIDVGMDVHGENPPIIGGQVIQSSPGGLCMRCLGFLTDEKLAKEAEDYGQAGGRPQVVWPNGVLASTAVGLAVDLVCDWTRIRRLHAYYSYNGNLATVTESLTLRGLKQTICPHYPLEEVGDPIYAPI